MDHKVFSGGAGSTVLIFFPTLKTAQEQDFWEGFVQALVSRGYRPSRVSFLRKEPEHLRGAADIIIPVWRTIDQMPEFAHLGDDNNPLIQKYFSDPQRVAAFESLLEFAGMTTSFSRGSAELDHQAYRRSGLAYIHFLLNIISEKAPSKVIVNNDTHPLHLVARYCADTIGVPAIHSERSPLVNQWFEAEGFYGKSEIKDFLSDGRWKQPGEHEARGKKVVEILRAAPAGHRAEDGQPFLSAPKHDASSRPRVLIPLDHALATGWSLPTHPLRLENYPIFSTPEEAITFFSDLGERLDVDIQIKTHPSEPHNAKFIDLVRNDERVAFVEGGFEDAINNCDILVCFLTKVAVTGLALGIPVVTIGANIAALSELTLHCNSRDEVETQVRTALRQRSHCPQREIVHRFLGYLDQRFFLGNRLENAGAKRLLDNHFPYIETSLGSAVSTDVKSIPTRTAETSSTVADSSPSLPGANPGANNRVIYYPPIAGEDDLIDTISRAAWFLSFSPVTNIVIPVTDKSLAKIIWRVAPGMDPEISKRFAALRSQVQFIFDLDDEKFKEEVKSCTAILCWQAQASHWLQREKQNKEQWLSAKKIWDVDPKFDRNEGATYIECGYRLAAKLDSVIETNRRKFDELSDRLGNFERAYVLATGPSAKDYKSLEHEGALGIVCNSVILDDELMQTLKPHFLVFADPIFHFGPSQYAASFRASLRRASERFEFHIVIPIKYNEIFLSSLPELADRVIAVPYTQSKHFNLDLRTEFELKVTANILTFLMLPLATSFASRIDILGCDGRPMSENSYFWKHNPNTQINDKMANIKSVHPGFFSIDYDEYYLKHCTLLEQQISEGESIGKKFVCMAYSHIPALNARMAQDFKVSIKNPSSSDHPRLLIIDSTKVGSTTATGQIKRRLLADWPSDKVMQILPPNGKAAWVMPLTAKSSIRPFVSNDDLLSTVRAFEPDVVYYRPLERHPCLEQACHLVLNDQDLPLVTHVMDDWPAMVGASDPTRAEVLNTELRDLFSRSYRALSISEKMSASFSERYGVPFEAIANGVDPDLCRRLSQEAEAVKKGRDEIVMRYTGALAQNMTFATVLNLARTVDRLQDAVALRFEIYTMPAWRKAFETAARGLRGVKIFDSVPDDQYERLLAESDILVLGYNFDSDSYTYIRYSLPNKLPEYLGSGAAVLAVGPSDTAAMELLHAHDLGLRVTTEDDATLADAITELAQNSELRRRLADRAQAWTFENRNINMISSRFAAILTEAATSKNTDISGHKRDEHLSVDETAVVADLLADRRGAAHIMLDVGAHFGTSAAYFDKLGWAIHCFEPDPSNREKLVKRFGSHKNVTIDTRAVSNEPAQGVSFFQSEESTGISGLHAFRDTHRESGKVDVTTVAAIMAEKAIAHVDFLKIDVEGFDFSVLKGVPWDKVQPDVIECEFEDYKTVPLGHTYVEVAEYLVDKGYAVYLSEWHPIIRYGQGHDWRRVVPFPGYDLPSDAWGNILAFREDPGLAAVTAAFERLKKARKPIAAEAPVRTVEAAVVEKEKASKPVAATSATVKEPAERTGKPTMQPPAYKLGFAERAANRLRGNTLLYRFGQFTYWLLRNMKRHFLLVVLAILPLAAIGWIGYAFAPYRVPAALGAGLLVGAYGFAAIVAFVAQRARRSISALRENIAYQGAAAARAELKANKLAREAFGLKEGLEREVSSIRDRIAAFGKDVDQRLTTDRQERGDGMSALGRQLQALEKTTADMAHRVEELAGSGTANAHQIAKTCDDIDGLRRHLEETMAAVLRIEGRVGKQSDELSTISTKVAPLEQRSDKFEHDLNRLAVRNQAVYQRFNRTLSKEQLHRLSTHWSALLGVKFSRARLAYLANRACSLEMMMKGRLATSIETIVLRSMVGAAPKRDDVAILEIGTLFGVGAAAVYETARNEKTSVHLTVLDPLDGYYEAGHLDILTGAQVSETTLRDNFAVVPVPQSDYSVIRLLSTDDAAFEQASARRYDVLIIDGDHSYDGVKYDFDRYGPLVRAGGYILFDDYDVEEWPDIKRYVDTEISTLEHLELVGADYRTAVYRVRGDSSVDDAAPLAR